MVMLLKTARFRARISFLKIMPDKTTYITQEGLDKMKAELIELKQVKRRELAERIESARDLGDLSENAEYHDAKDALALVESRIREIQETMKDVSLIDAGSMGGVISIGSSITVEVNGKERQYTIVGSSEANPIEGLISNESPMGSAFLGHRVGDTVLVDTPAGETAYRVLKVG